MKHLSLIVILFIVGIFSATAQYAVMEPRVDYLQAFTRTGTNITWSRTIVTDKSQAEIVAEITSHITVTTIIDNIVIGKVEDVYFGTNASLLQAVLPWDSSRIKANVVYKLTDDGYIVTVSNIMYQNDAFGPKYDTIYYIICNRRGELRSRADYDFRYLDNAFCDLLLLFNE